MQEEHGFLWRVMLDTIDTDLVGRRVLDAGCNRGGFLRLLVDESRIGEGYGYDPASGAIEDARRLAGLRPLTFEPPTPCPPDGSSSTPPSVTRFSTCCTTWPPTPTSSPRRVTGAELRRDGRPRREPHDVGVARSVARELALPRLYDLDEVVEVFEGAGFEVSVARLPMRFVPVSAGRGGHEHRRDLMGWLDYYERDKVLSGSPALARRATRRTLRSCSRSSPRRPLLDRLGDAVREVAALFVGQHAMVGVGPEQIDVALGGVHLLPRVAEEGHVTEQVRVDQLVAVARPTRAFSGSCTSSGATRWNTSSNTASTSVGRSRSSSRTPQCRHQGGARRVPS